MKYYAVRKGRTTGILNSWEECKKSVIGFKGAEYKSFASIEDAKNFINPAKSSHSLPSSDNPCSVTAYVDGSFNVKTNIFSCGVVIIHNNQEIKLKEKFEDSNLASMRNVAGEIKGAMKAMEYCIQNNINELHIFYDYDGIEKWCTGDWKTNKPATSEYKKFYNDMKNNLDIYFHKVKGHSGDKYNDMADALAKEAAGIV